MCEEEGWCGGHTVYVSEGRQTSSVLGPDGEPVSYIRKPERIGFDLRPKKGKREAAE